MTSSTTRETDRQLLERFVADADAEAFGRLVQRHGPMVLGVCRQILRQEQDAEDVFQATFLVLSRKAGSIRAGEALPNWLYGVARRLALRGKSAAVRRQAREVALVEPPPAPLAPESAPEDLAPVLHEEIGRLPDKYRIPFVLCYLDGKTNEEAAQQLGCPSGTVFSRLARARERLRARLTRRGLALSTGVLTTTLAALAQQAQAAAPQQLATTTVRWAIRFARKGARAADIPEEIRELAEWGTKVPSRRLVLAAVGGGVLLALLLLIGGTLLVLRLIEPPIPERLQGTWKMTAMNVNGAPAPAAFLDVRLAFANNRMILAGAAGTFRIDADKNPMQIDWTLPNGVSQAIFELRGDTLTLCVGPQRPGSFQPGPGISVMVFERMKP
jgi:RNA polymerase sigma factor (sigma-70 family)